ncbi:MAG: hypothetical protein CV087_02540 [Candidatus Brocadia sp. WS118]|nr:MAG: hypothetical protein CV087_02540 [Candidatus Brocadia sp. WS118]
MTGFKQTDIGTLPEDWEVREIKDLVLDTETRNPQKKPTKKIKYIDVSSVSNQTFSVISYQDYLGKDAPGRARKVVYKNDVIFATVRPTLKRIAKISQEYNNEYCSTAFCVLRVDKNKLDFVFLYQYLLTNFFVKEIAKHQTGASYPAVRDDDVKKTKMPYPPLNEQSNIAKILSIIQSAIETQEKIIQTTTELKKALMQKFFTEGLRGEAQKETEIGKVPKSWEVKRIEEVYDFTSKPRGINWKKTKHVPFIPMELIPDDNLFVRDFESRDADDLSSGTYIENGDLLIAKITPSFENGKQAIVDFEHKFGFATTEVIPINEKERISNKHYLYYYLLKNDVRSMLTGKMEGSTGRQRLSKTVLGETLIPFPSCKEQAEISEMFIKIDNKIHFCKTKAVSLQSLFKSMLHHLMTGQIRVKELKFS